MTERNVRSADGTSIAYRSLGAGEPLIVVGGVLRKAEDYQPLAEALADSFEVHLIERRGRGASGPLGGDYSIEKEGEDLDAVRRETGATLVFGHSYGGLIALEAAKHMPLERVAVYEPGISVGGSIPLDWLSGYNRRLAAGDERGAFAELVRGSGHAPALLTRLPFSFVRLVLRLAIRGRQWDRMRPLLHANAIEHEQVRLLDGTAHTYRSVSAPVLLLGGTKSPRSSELGIETLYAVLPNATLELLDGLTHNAPDEGAPERVAEAVAPFLRASGGRS